MALITSLWVRERRLALIQKSVRPFNHVRTADGLNEHP